MSCPLFVFVSPLFALITTTMSLADCVGLKFRYSYVSDHSSAPRRLIWRLKKPRKINQKNTHIQKTIYKTTRKQQTQN